MSERKEVTQTNWKTPLNKKGEKKICKVRKKIIIKDEWGRATRKHIVQRLTEKQKGFLNGYKSTQNCW